MARKTLADSFPAALLASLFVQAGAASFLAGRGLTGSALVSLGAAILIGRLKAAGILTGERLSKFAIAVLMVAFAAELFMMYVRSRLGGAGDGPYAGERAPGGSSGKYRGVILWQDMKPPPGSRASPAGVGARTQPQQTDADHSVRRRVLVLQIPGPAAAQGFVYGSRQSFGDHVPVRGFRAASDGGAPELHHPHRHGLLQPD
jgi:hypothetical protein